MFRASICLTIKNDPAHTNGEISSENNAPTRLTYYVLISVCKAHQNSEICACRLIKTWVYCKYLRFVRGRQQSVLEPRHFGEINAPNFRASYAPFNVNDRGRIFHEVKLTHILFDNKKFDHRSFIHIFCTTLIFYWWVNKLRTSNSV